MTKLRNFKAFTLIELIVVIVIIGILAAVAAVAYNSFIANAHDSALKASASQIAKVIQAESAYDQVAPSTAAFVLSSQAGDDINTTGATVDLTDLQDLATAGTSVASLDVTGLDSTLTCTITLAGTVGTANDVSCS